MAEDNHRSTESGAAEAPGSTTEGQGSDVQLLQAQIEKFKNDYLYLRAEFENYKRNAIKERSDLVKFGSERLVVELLNVVDNFERALSAEVTADSFAHFVKGISMTHQELRALLTKHNVEEVPSQGAPFDPNIHEALSSEESSSLPPGHVSRVFRKPYKMHGKIIRPGQVVVAKAPSQPS